MAAHAASHIAIWLCWPRCLRCCQSHVFDSTSWLLFRARLFPTPRSLTSLIYLPAHVCSNDSARQHARKRPQQECQVVITSRQTRLVKAPCFCCLSCFVANFMRFRHRDQAVHLTTVCCRGAHRLEASA